MFARFYIDDTAVNAVTPTMETNHRLRVWILPVEPACSLASLLRLPVVSGGQWPGASGSRHWQLQYLTTCTLGFKYWTGRRAGRGAVAARELWNFELELTQLSHGLTVLPLALCDTNL